MSYRLNLIVSLAALASMTTSAIAETPCPIWNYWGTGAEHDAIQAIIDLSNKLHPDTPVVDHFIPGNTVELRRALQTALLGGTAPAGYQSAMGYELKTFVDAGALRPITDVWNAVGGDTVFPRGLQRVMKVDGKPYGMPLNMGIINNIFYNKAIFEKLHLTPPKSFEELRALCEKIEVTGIGCLADASGPFGAFTTFIHR